jgi:exodeoxyribonuclease VII small subunit
MPAKKKADFDFEVAMKNLENIVENMETGELSLEAAMEKFEQGVKLTRDCHQALQKTEQQVKILLDKQGEFTLTEFASDELGDAEDDE